MSEMKEWLDAFSEFNATPGSGITRQLYTREDIGMRVFLKDLMLREGLEVKEDSVGNVFGTLPGEDRNLSPVWSGSHTDSVFHGGAFDGTAGVACALQAVHSIRTAAARHLRDIVVTAYAGEEPARFGIGCIGSRAMSGRLSLEDLGSIRDQDGITLYDAMKEAGYVPDKISGCRKQPGSVWANVELHIEQNNVLERNHLPLGVVTHICAPGNLKVHVQGRTGHAGGIPMEYRRDAFAAVAEMVLAVERCVKNTHTGKYCTGTVGQINVLPNVSNIIPGDVFFTVDIRDSDADSKNLVIGSIEKEIAGISSRRGVKTSIILQNNDLPVRCDDRLIAMIEESCQALNLPYMELISGAFHDSLFIADFARTAMIFVPSKNGLSHCPEEWTDYFYLDQGAEVLKQTLLKLSNLVPERTADEKT